MILGKKKKMGKKCSSLSYLCEKAYVVPIQANSIQVFMTVSYDLSIANSDTSILCRTSTSKMFCSGIAFSLGSHNIT